MKRLTAVMCRYLAWVQAGDIEVAAIPPATFCALLDRGLVEFDRPPGTIGRRARLTEAGKTYEVPKW